MLKYFTIFTSLFVAATANAQVEVSADDAKINYWGRVDFTNTKAPAFEFPGVTIKAKFTGTSIKATLNDFAAHGSSTTNYYYKIIDGGTPVKFEALKGTNSYTLASGLTSTDTHTVEIIKLTEANVGRTAFLGFTLDAGASLVSFANPTCRIEFIGNSITCGYGNDTSIAAPPSGNPSSGFTSKHENNYKAWGYVAARKLGMQYSAVSYSGRGLYRNNDASTAGVLPSIYDRIYPDNSSLPTWSHTAYRLNYIVIDLGTNDFYPDPTNPLSQTAFESAYVNFVKKLKSYHPNASIILAVGVMMSDSYPAGANQWTRIRTYVKNAISTLTTEGYNNVYYFEMDPQSAPYGEDWHPSAATHSTMGNNLATFISSLGKSCDNSSSGPDYSVSNWLDNKKAAVALTFDDWSAGHSALVVPELTKRNINATFCITNNVGAWSSVQSAYNLGNEIANHSKTHMDLTTATAAQKNTEIRGAKNTILSNLKNAKVLSYIYPYGAYNQEVIDSVKKSNHIGARSVYPSSGNYSYNFAPTDDDYYKVLTTAMDSTVTLGQYYTQIKNIISGGGFLTYLYHSIYSADIQDNNYAQIHVKNLSKQLDTLVSQKDNVWITTFGQAIQYHREKKTAVLSETSAPFASGSTWKLNLTDQLPDSLYFQALTVQVRIPDTITNVLSVMQNNASIPFSISRGNLVFNAVPDGGEITVNVSACQVPMVSLVPTSGTISICVPNSAILSATHTAGNTYEWYLNGNSIENTNNDTLQVDSAGVYTVKITNNNCEINSATYGKSIIVSNTGNCGEPRANFAVDRNPSTLSQVLTFTNLSENTETTSVAIWNFGENVEIINNNSTVSNYSGNGPLKVLFKSTGKKKITLVVTGSVKNDTIVKEIEILDAVPCVMYEDFNNNDYHGSFLGGWNNYTFTEENSALKVTVPSTSPNEWYSFNTYFRNENNEKINVNFSDITKNPVIKFIAKASDTLTLKASLVDANGIIADGAVLGTKNKFDVTGTYKYYELNMRGLFFNQWNSTVLDSTKIAGVEFRINSGYQSYPFKNTFGQTVSSSFVGTLEIEWIGVNDKCTAPVTIDVKDETLQDAVQIHPNPVNEVLFIASNSKTSAWVISNTVGEKLLEGETNEANIGSLPAGVYFIKIGNRVKKFVKL
ncbi:MAG: polysaccharide deacetylase family protein [Cytophagales bacterium]